MMAPPLGTIRRSLDAVCPYEESPDAFEWQTLDAEGVLANWGDLEAIADHLDDTSYVAVACDQWGWVPHPPEVVRRLIEQIERAA
jgi:hypothetical protein